MAVMGSIWNPDNIIDVAESVGIAALNRDVVEHLARDVEFRLSLIVEEALKFMRNGRRTTLSTQDISLALKVLGVEPLYGYDSTRPLKFGEASIGPGQPLFYVEDDEVDFEKLINAPLPKVPREIAFTAHWLAVEGVQPSIPQNPTQVDQRSHDLVVRGTGPSPALAAVSGSDNAAVKPLVKHVLSKELQLYFERICSAILDDSNEEYRNAAIVSLRIDPGLHQLVPYLVQFTADKITHNLRNLFVLRQSLSLIDALLSNESIFLAAYVPSIIPSILTCMLAKQMGTFAVDGPVAHFEIRHYASSVLIEITKRYGSSSSTMKPRIARACLKHFLDSHRSPGSHYGAVLYLTQVAGVEGIRALILPCLKTYDVYLQQANLDESRKIQVSFVTGAIVDALCSLRRAGPSGELSPAWADEAELAASMVGIVGEEVTSKLIARNIPGLITTILDLHGTI